MSSIGTFTTGMSVSVDLALALARHLLLDVISNLVHRLVQLVEEERHGFGGRGLGGSVGRVWLTLMVL